MLEPVDDVFVMIHILQHRAQQLNLCTMPLTAIEISRRPKSLSSLLSFWLNPLVFLLGYSCPNGIRHQVAELIVDLIFDAADYRSFTTHHCFVSITGNFCR